ncbi:MAG: hypothetical protein J0L93_08325 [Deltaproteobacteria bacterium]|nr:hypothetical protein [Deltaproteobacteria bacterium]
MKLTSTHSSELFKTQAQRLREFLKRSNVNFSHSQCLEAIAHLHGFQDWNTASAKAKSERKLYIVCCEFSKIGDTKIGFFQYLIRAQSTDDVVNICRKEFQKFLEKGDAFDKGTDIYLTDIVEVIDVNEGALVNWMAVDTENDSRSTMGHILPFGDSGSKLKVYQCHDEGAKDDEHSPFVTLS